MRVLIFGDSITQGFFDVRGGWVGRLREHYDMLQLKNPTTYSQPVIFNLGISGDTAEKLVRRFENETEARLWPDEDMAFVFSIGTNDASTRNLEPFSTPEKYRNQLEELIKMAKRFS